MTIFSKEVLFDTLNIGIGNQEGVEFLSVAGQSTNVGAAFTNLTPTGGLQTLPTGVETWEIVSTDANDSSAGTGARTVAIFSLDGSYVEQTTVVAMDGLTPVVIGNTHLRSRTAIVLTAGSDASNTNIGDLIIRVSGGGTERMRIPAGEGDSKSFLFTVPADKTAFAQNIVLFCAKNEDCIIRPLLTPLGGATISAGDISTYQNAQSVPITALIRVVQKTDVIVNVKSTNEASTALTFISFIIVDNELLVDPT